MEWAATSEVGATPLEPQQADARGRSGPGLHGGAHRDVGALAFQDYSSKSADLEDL